MPAQTTMKRVQQSPEIQVWQNDSKRKYIFSYSAKIVGDNLGAFYVEGGSASIDQEIAKNKAVFESIERYSGSKIPSTLKKCAYTEIKNEAIDPRKFIFYSSSQLNKSGFPYSRYNTVDQIEWIEAESLLNSKIVFVPAFAVYLGYNERTSGGKKYFPTPSSGLAIQATKTAAIANAILELVERNNAMKVWLDKQTPPIVDLSTIQSTRLNNLILNIKKEKLNIAVLLSSQKLPIPSFISIVYSENETPIATFGLSAGFEIEQAILKSIEEALMVRCSTEYMKKTYDDKVFYKTSNQVRSFFDHSLYYSLCNKRKLWQFMLRGRKMSINQIKIKHVSKLQEGAYNTLNKTLKEFSYDTYIVDLTSDIAKGEEFFCVKVIIPKLRQMEINNNYKFLGYGGLKDKKKLVKSRPHPYA